jgi:hypothetical protein
MRFLFIFAAVAAFCLSSRVNAETQLESKIIAINLNDEAYLGAISYSGGLMERGRLNLANVEDIRYLRIEIPTHCHADVFEVGTTTEGIDDLAESTRVAGVFAVNQGRGNHVRGIFISLNGPQSQECSVLVFRRNSLDSTPSNPGGSPLQTLVCIENPFSSPIAAQINVSGKINNVVLAPLSLAAIQHPVRTNAPSPSLTIKFDRDLTPNVFWTYYSLVVGNSRSNNCMNNPVYRFVNPRPYLLDLTRVH